MTTTALTPRASEAIAEADRTIDMIERMVRDPAADISKLERLLALKERVIADQRKAAFMAAKSALLQDLPVIKKTSEIRVKGQLRSKYTKLEHLDIIVRPLLQAHGFSFSFNVKQIDAKHILVIGTLSHCDGHSEEATFPLPIDESDFRSKVQNVGSSLTYARRQLIKMHLNIIEQDEDDDGAGGPKEKLSAEQVRALGSALDTKHGDEAKFLDWAAKTDGADRYETLGDIPADSFERCMRVIGRMPVKS